jgi:hypothetical protein
MSEKVTVPMAVEKETPGTFRFKEDVREGQKAIIGTIYVPKATLDLLGFTSEKSIIVTVEVAE